MLISDQSGSKSVQERVCFFGPASGHFVVFRRESHRFGSIYVIFPAILDIFAKTLCQESTDLPIHLVVTFWSFFCISAPSRGDLPVFFRPILTERVKKSPLLTSLFRQLPRWLCSPTSFLGHPRSGPSGSLYPKVFGPKVFLGL